MSSSSTASSSQLLEQANATVESNPRQAEKLLLQVLDSSPTEPEQAAANLKDREAALTRLAKLYRDENNAQALAEIVRKSRSFMSSSAKAKTARLIRSLLDLFSTLPDSTQVLTDVILENIEWAKKEKQIFLKQSLEIRLVALHLDNNAFKPALALVDNLLTELKRLDDKLILTEVHLLESRIYRGLGNMPKAKAALTSARTAANAIYCPPHLQAALDLQSGVLHAEDKDYKTAYSYFFETFENLSAQDDPKALNSLKYMLLCKIMLNLPEDVTSLLSIKLALKYAQLKEVESMRAVARAHQNRNLAEFEKALRDYRDELSSDPTIRSHLAALYDTLLEQNLLRIVEPYACVEVDHVAKVVGQDRQQIEQKLSQMILDKVFNGVLDQGRGCLIIFDAPEEDVAYESAIQMLEQVGKVVDSLYTKAVKLA